jgi:hypothetical protein
MQRQQDTVAGELQATYQTLGALVDRAVEQRTSIAWHVLSAARALVHDAYLEAQFPPRNDDART